MMLLSLCILHYLFGSTLGQCDGSFRFASYYGDSMVLQRSPAAAVVWGHAAQAGLPVEVDVGGTVYNTDTVIGNGGTPIWSVTLTPTDATTIPVAITATSTSDSCSVAISDVLFGDVYVCSGQSNMVHRLDRLDNADTEIEDAVNYPNVRSFMVALEYSDTPQYDLISVQRGWTIPDSSNMAQFSAVCWLFGRDMNTEFNIPIGLIQSAWGGTRVEAWSSPDALNVCFPDGPSNGNNQNAASALWNAMIHPLLTIPIFGALWYQGEANNGNSEFYSCAISEMVSDWRQRWFTDSQGTMNAQFPFGQVQLAPNAAGDVDTGFPYVRWAQVNSLGYTPNPMMENVFTAIALDLPDYDSPYGAIHPRYKRQVAQRLAYGAYQLAYGITTYGPYQGPLPSSAVVNGATVEVTYDNGNANIEVRTNGNFDLCCADAATDRCEENNGVWTPTLISSNTASSVTLDNPCSNFVTGLRYAWRVSPCDLEMCAVYGVDNELPAPPYMMDI